MKQFLLLLLLVLTQFLDAQEFKLGKVTKEELQEKVHPTDTSAAAAILHKRGKTYFIISDGYFEMVNEVEMRIKIYKKEGYKYATDKITYYSGGKTLKVYFTDAYTYNLVGGAIEKTKLKSEGEFVEKVNDEFTRESITMPNVKEGSVIEYKYVLKTPYFMKFSDYYFQYDIPVNSVTYETTVPAYFDYKRYLSGYVKIDIPEQKVRGNSYGYNEVITNYSAKNVPALKDEAHVNNIDNYTSILKYELGTYTMQDGTKKKYSLDWQSMAKKVYEMESFGDQLKQTEYFEADLKNILTPGMTPEAKMAAILSYVQDRMTWNEKNDYVCDKGVKKAYAAKTGNAAEINLMLTAMLRSAGLNADPVLISTRSNGVSLFPSLTAYNYVVAGVYHKESFILLDATSKYTVLNQLPVRALNWLGRLIKPNGNTAEIDLVPKVISREIIFLTSELGKDGKLSGKIRDQYFDLYGYSFRENNSGSTTDTYVEKLEKQFPGMLVGDYKILNDDDLSKPVAEEFTFTHAAVVDIIGDKMYLNPMLFFAKHINPFKQEKREYPIDFVYPTQDKFMITIKLPEGYTVEQVPAPLSLAMEEGLGSFKYNVVVQNGQMQLTSIFDVNVPHIEPEFYNTLKDFYRKMIEKQNEKIVLKRI